MGYNLGCQQLTSLPEHPSRQRGRTPNFLVHGLDKSFARCPRLTFIYFPKPLEIPAPTSFKPLNDLLDPHKSNSKLGNSPKIQGGDFFFFGGLRVQVPFRVFL